MAALLCVAATATAQDPLPPQLTEPINDFARVLDPGSAAAMEKTIRALQQASGDAVVVATVQTFMPYGDIREYAVKMFENHGRGIGEKGRDNGVLILLAVDDRQVWVEVGYGLEEFITDGFAGEISRKAMVPHFRRGNYGEGLRAGVDRIVGRIAQRKNLNLGMPIERPAPNEDVGLGGGAIFFLILLFVLLNIIGRTRRRRRLWGGRPWSGWHSGVGPFGGGFGGGFRGGGGGFGGGFGGFGGGGGGGFGGFGGGRSGGGGASGGW